MLTILVASAIAAAIVCFGDRLDWRALTAKATGSGSGGIRRPAPPLHNRRASSGLASRAQARPHPAPAPAPPPAPVVMTPEIADERSTEPPAPAEAEIPRRPHEVTMAEIRDLLAAERSLARPDVNLVMRRATENDVAPFTMLAWAEKFGVRVLAVGVAADLSNHELIERLAHREVPNLASLEVLASLNGLGSTQAFLADHANAFDLADLADQRTTVEAAPAVPLIVEPALVSRDADHGREETEIDAPPMSVEVVEPPVQESVEQEPTAPGPAESAPHVFSFNGGGFRSAAPESEVVPADPAPEAGEPTAGPLPIFEPGMWPGSRTSAA